jgi:two-component system OmpR family response regulator
MSENPEVLVAIDDDRLRNVICETLARARWRVESYADGVALLNALSYRFDHLGSPPDLIIADVNMPGRSGFDVVEQLRRYDQVTPVIFLTAVADAQTHAAASQLGACRVMEVPFAPSDLRALAADCLGV